MTKMLIDRSTVEQALEALRCVDLQSLVPDYGSGHYSVARSDGPQVKSAITAMEAALAEPQEPDSPERRCGGPGCDMRCCQPVQEPVAPIGYLSRVRAQVEQQRTCFPGEEPDYLWAYTHGTKNLELFESSSDLDVVRVYTSPPQRKPLSGVAIYGLFVRSGLGAYHQKDFVVQTEYDRCIERFARAVERAHGIGGKE